MSRLVLVLVFAAVSIIFSRADHQYGVCQLPFCECTAAAHPSWMTVNCTVPSDQKLNIFEGDLPESTTSLIISGGDAVMFSSNSLSHLKDTRQISIVGSKIIMMRKFAAINLNLVSGFLNIENCDVLRIEERTFSNIKGPLTTLINNCDYVNLEGEAFSWLLTLTISNVKKLQLGIGSFTLDPTAANVGEHGPGMSIRLQNVTVPEIPAQTFGSSAASVTMESVEVRAIRSGAFSANTYNIIMATNCSFHLIEEEAFTQKSLIINLHFVGCKIHQLATRALQSAVSSLNISNSRLENINTGAINATVASVIIIDSVFNKFMERGFELSSWNKLRIQNNSFDELAPNAFVAPVTSIHELIFAANEIETIYANSLGFIGEAATHSPYKIVYKDNYYGQPCNCNISLWLGKVLGVATRNFYEDESYCTVNEFFARCFNVPEQNMLLKSFLDSVCTEELSIKCEPFKAKVDGAITEIKNPRFPHKNQKEDEALSDRNKKVIGIVIVTCFGCVIIALFITLIRWMRRKGYCMNVKNFLISSNSSCGSFCVRLCICGKTTGIDNARSISQLSVNEYSERHCLNEPRVQEIMQETNIQDVPDVPSVDKMTQTLPEELTKELLENLKEKLENPDNYVEAREMIEHLYELTKMEENCNSNHFTLINVDENIYELPFQNTAPRVGKNKKQMVSVGTRAPSLDKLTPLSPYNRQTALAHEYFEPKDFAVHLYAEIANCEKEKRNLLGAMPDVIAEQAIPRGPYLRAVRDKMSSSASGSPSTKSLNSSIGSPRHMSSIKSSGSNSSSKMINRPLPEKPVNLDPGEGTSYKHG